MAREQELVGTVQRVIFAKDNFVIAALLDGGVVKGSATVNDLKTELTYRFFGKSVEHPEYGKQFHFSSYAADIPHEEHGIVTYLVKEADGIGQIAAGKLWDRFGAEAVDVIVRDPQRAVDAGCITARVAKKAQESLASKVADQKTRIDLLHLFSGLGFPGQLIPKLIEKWKVQAPQIVREDPFRLVLEEMPGCGFLRVDHLHHQLGLPPTSPRRQMVCAWQKVHSNNDGHTWMPESEVVRQVTELIGMDSDPDWAIQQALDNNLLKRYDAGNMRWLSVPHRCETEGAVAKGLMRLLAVAPSLWPTAEELGALTDHQRETVRPLLAHTVAVLTGTPGTGKTFTSAQIIKALHKTVPPDEIAVCAPTGKAAVRITKALHQYDVDIEATTLHKLLRIDRQTRNGFVFVHNQSFPLPYRVVIVDEVSMLDTALAGALFDALAPGTHLLMVGDPYQLPPVGHGAPLRDMIDAGVPCGELTEIRRNSGLIVKACSDIKSGYRYETCQQFNDENGHNFRSVEAPTNEAILEHIRTICKKLVEKASDEPGFIDPIEQAQVLTVVNAQSVIGRYALNQLLQKELNPNGEACGPHPYRVGDKVICLVNSRMTVVETTPGQHGNRFDAWFKTSDERTERYVANGDMGRVLAVSPGKLVVRFYDPDRTVWVPVANRANKGDDDADDGSAGWGPIDLGYAITTHKSQGSEWPLVIMPLDDSDRARRVACRELLYTAVSRAKWRCLLIGRRAVADQWCQIVIMRKRKTFLRERILQAATKAGIELGRDLYSVSLPQE